MVSSNHSMLITVAFQSKKADPSDQRIVYGIHLLKSDIEDLMQDAILLGRIDTSATKVSKEAEEESGIRIYDIFILAMARDDIVESLAAMCSKHFTPEETIEILQQKKIIAPLMVPRANLETLKDGPEWSISSTYQNSTVCIVAYDDEEQRLDSIRAMAFMAKRTVTDPKLRDQMYERN